MAIKQEERRNIRLVTGENDPETGAVLATSGCIPIQIAKSGKFTTDGIKVLGDGDSDFENEFKVDSFLYSATLNEIRQVKGVNGTANMELYYSFSADISTAEVVHLVKTQLYASIVTKNTGSADALVQEVTLPSGEVDIRDFDLGCAPFTYDAQTSTLMFHISE